MSNNDIEKKPQPAIILNKNKVKKFKFDKIIIRCNGKEAHSKFFDILGLNKKDYKDHEEKPLTEDVACDLERYDKYPAFNYSQDCWAIIHIKFGDDEDIMEFNNKFKDADYDFGIQAKTKSLWFPKRPELKTNQQYWCDNFTQKAQYPIYIISKGRYEKMLTADALLEMKQPFKLVIEESEFLKYKKGLLDKGLSESEVKEHLLLFSDEDKKHFTTGEYEGHGASIPVRNFIWQHSIKAGFKRHWCLDDNLDGFYRVQNNARVKCISAVPFRVCERWSDDFSNVFMSGLNYLAFLPEISRRRKQVQKNTRIYSCILLHNEANKNMLGKKGTETGNFLWRGKYNEDTDLSLRLLKSGHPTMLLNNFVCNKQTTMSCKGGNTDSIYKGDGLQKKLDSLIAQHPDVAKGTIKFKKVHHQVNYKSFENNKFKIRTDVKLLHHTDRNYGLKLKDFGGTKIVKRLVKKKDYILEEPEVKEPEPEPEPKNSDKLANIMEFIKEQKLTEEEKKKLICLICMS